MTGAELADELSTIADAYCADTREAWRMARFVNANMVAILAALRSERSAVGAGAVERVTLEKLVEDWTEASAACLRISDADAGHTNGFVAQGEANALKDCAQDLRAALAAAQERANG